ncbi:MAG TPA: hypothetical protein VFE53_17645 [Mucilaginibacter sp.]|jgi:hypothetical protein|nr:hypothetical protein [Mucilaginibacter sp.]
MASINELEKLDKVLLFLEKQEFESALPIGEISTGVKNIFTTDETEVISILNKLVKDEYANTFQSPMNYIHSETRKYTILLTYFIITFEGRYFIKTGGYVRREEFRISEKTRLDGLEAHQREQANTLNRLTRLVAWGTVAASVVAFLLLVWETRHAILRLWYYIFY